ncbi:hypothetical protein [Neobacillus cucumis]|uniref:hypothetical protein n=1 Tax=Neobacillus cucumis TaxID=1740721 RepID=UPI0019633FF2|nr:hypothetical protein [Neobacillus cucumis]MBM7651769.1 hypothetical protein [Neobacillus cucumis]
MMIGELWDYEPKFAYYFIGTSSKLCRFTTNEELKEGSIVAFNYIPVGATLVKVTGILEGKKYTTVMFEPVDYVTAVEVRDVESLSRYDLKENENEQ